MLKAQFKVGFAPETNRERALVSMLEDALDEVRKLKAEKDDEKKCSQCGHDIDDVLTECTQYGHCISVAAARRACPGDCKAHDLPCNCWPAWSLSRLVGNRTGGGAEQVAQDKGKKGGGANRKNSLLTQ